jgi:uncharacterized membrane protein
MAINGKHIFAGLQWKHLLIPAACGIFFAWLWFTPPGLLGKADAVGYAVCHRISTHSLFFGDRQMPLCARCSGMYLGAILCLLFQTAQGRRGSLPSKGAFALFALAVLAFGLDGVNSYLHFFPQAPSLYQPQNWLRFITGAGMGITIIAFLLPIFHQTFWTTWDTRPALGNWKQMLGLIILTGGLAGLVLSGNPLILFPLALLSSAGVLMILTMVYSMVLLMLFKSENRFERLSQIWLPVLAGLTLAMIQIGAMDLGRFLLTGTWSGFSL